MDSRSFERFRAQCGPMDDPEACWVWKTICKGPGYGKFYVKAIQKQRGAHRVSYEHFVGPIPVGKEIDHQCRNRACVNPRHLRPVTHKENVHLGAASKPLWRCKAGLHDLTLKKNYRLFPNGAKYCLPCRRAHDQSPARRASRSAYKRTEKYRAHNREMKRLGLWSR